MVAVAQPAAGGTVAIAPGGTGVVFTPAAGFAGDATFTYAAGDGTLGSTATAAVTVSVEPVGLGPVRQVAVGGATDGTIRLTGPGGTTGSITVFPGVGGTTRTASADVDADGVVVTGPGVPLRVAVISG